MKNLLKISAVLVLIVALSSCGGRKDRCPTVMTNPASQNAIS